MEYNGYNINVGTVLVCGREENSYKQFFYVFSIDEESKTFLSSGIDTNGGLYRTSKTWAFDRIAHGKEYQLFHNTLRKYNCVVDTENQVIRKE